MQIPGSDVKNAVCVDQESHFNASHSRGHRIDSLQIEAGQAAAVFHQFALALDDVDQHIRLPVYGRCKMFRCASGNGGVAMNKPGNHSAHRLNPER